jgi:anti-sigma factor RsiW
VTAPAILDADLHAYVDGQLGPRRREAVRRYLAGDPAAAARAARWTIEREALRARLDPVAAEVLPLRMSLARLDPPAPARGAERRRVLFGFIAGFALGSALVAALLAVLGRI